MNSHYTQDVEFNSGFGAMQTPVHIFTAAALCGFSTTPVHQPFRFLDLACGNGLTLALLADAYPHAFFVGIDINPDHIKRAEERAKAADLTNIQFYVGDILTLKSEDYSPFDYCAVSGVYSWLDPARRNALRDFLAGVTKCGGAVYLDYSTQPGMAQTAALYHLIQEIAQNFEGNSAEKITKAANFAEQMRNEGALFFEANPVAASRLKTILSNPPGDEAHEVLNLKEGGFWSADVLREMKGAGFDFVGHSGLHNNFPKFSARPNSLKHTDEFVSATKQSLFDVNWNVPHRRDIFIRNDDEESFKTLLDILRNQYIFAAPSALSEGQRIKLGEKFKAFDFTGPKASLYSDIAIVSQTFGRLFNDLKEKGMTDAEITSLTELFLATRLLSVAVSVAGEMENSGNFAMSTPLNQMILEEDIATQNPRPFSSSVAGTRVMLPLKDRLYLSALIGMDLNLVWQRLGDLQAMFRDDRNNAIDQEQFSKIIKSSLPGFKAHIVPELLRLKLLRETS